MPVKLLTSGGGGVNLVPSSSIASDQTMYLPTSGTSGGTVLCTDSTGGTANGVLYLNGSKQVTSGSGLVFDGANLGIGSGVIYASPLKVVTSSSATSQGTVRFGSSSNEYSISSGADYLGMLFTTNGSERMRLDTSGNLGIGTASPAAKLHLNNGNVRLDSDSGTTTITVIKNGVGLGSLTTFGDTVATDFYTATVFKSSGVEKMRLDSSGNLLVGTTTAYGKLTVNGNAYNTTGVWGTISDQKLKENIVDATPKLDSLCKVKVRNYNLIGDELKQIGVIAQELEEIFPSMVDGTPDYEEVTTTDEDGNEKTERVATGTTTKSVKYSVFVPMLIKAVQEQQAIIESQAQTIESLTQRIEALEYTKQGE